MAALDVFGRIGAARGLATALLIVMLGWAIKPANGDFVTYSVAFTAHTFQVGSGPDPAPVDPVVGHFTVTLDPTVHVTNQTAGITMNSINIALGSPLSFTYNPAAEGPFSAGTLRVGGLNAGSDVIIFNPSTNDFWLFISDFTTAPAFQQMGYTQTSVSNNNLFFTLNQTGSVSSFAIPEPSLLGLAVVAIPCALVRRRKR